MILKKTGRKIMPQVFILLAVGFLAAGCGKKAPPRPPAAEAALAAVGSLSKTLSGETLSLTWSLLAGKGREAAGFYVYRSKMRLGDSDCPSCPVLFKRIAVIPRQGPGSGDAIPRSFEYRETLEKGYRYIYKVAAYSHDGLTGKDSNVVEVVR